MILELWGKTPGLVAYDDEAKTILIQMHGVFFTIARPIEVKEIIFDPCEYPDPIQRYPLNPPKDLQPGRYELHIENNIPSFVSFR